MTGINYKIFIREQLNEFHKVFPEYTVAQVLFSSLKQMDGYSSFKKEDLLSLSDEDLYTAMENSLRKEKEKFHYAKNK